MAEEAQDGWRRLRARRGSALILVLLILLALSAIGMVALRDVSRSVQHSGQFRVRTTAGIFSDGVAGFLSKRIGDKANHTWNKLQSFKGFDRNTMGTNWTSRKQIETQGGYLKYQQKPGGTADEQDFSSLLPVSGSESGLFTDGNSSHRSFESKEGGTEFRAVVRDPHDGIPLPGYSDKMCFKKVTIATQAQIGNPQGSWSEPRQVGVGRTISEALIGPTTGCGN